MMNKTIEVYDEKVEIFKDAIKVMHNAYLCSMDLDRPYNPILESSDSRVYGIDNDE